VSTLHITNGDSAGDTLRRIVTDAVTITADPLHEGPAPPVEGDAWYEVRARFLASDSEASHEDVKNHLAAWDRAIVDGCRAGDIILWFEHDLFDQLLLIRTLDLLVRLKPDTTYDDRQVRLLAPRTTAGKVDTTYDKSPDDIGPYVVSGFPPPLPATMELRRGQAEAQRAKAGSRTVAQVSLICIDSFPGVERFVGLGQLTDEQLATLIGTERPVTSEQYALASRTWKAFRSPDPTELLAIARKADTPRTLPFLGDALQRFFAEFPAAANGLSRTQELALGALRDGGMTGGALFVAAQAVEPRPFLGDTTFFGILRALGSARVPLVTISGLSTQLDLRSHGIAITDAGRDVLAGRRDHVALNGIDLWRGGVHLAGRDTSPWRWDGRGETLVS
jgi:hypothetical protein